MKWYIKQEWIQVWRECYRKMSFRPKLAQSLNMIIVFVAVVWRCFFCFITKAGYDEINDVRNWKYNRYFLTLGDIILRIVLSLRKNDENDSIFSSFRHTDVTATFLKLNVWYIELRLFLSYCLHIINNKIETWSKEDWFLYEHISELKVNAGRFNIFT